MLSSEWERIERELIHQEILEQRAIAAALAGRARPRWPDGGGRTVVTGAGDSLCAADLVAALFPGRGIEARPALDASALASGLDASAPGLGAADALLGVSVSGRTPRVVEACLRARRAGARTVAVTDDPQSPLASACEETWRIGASPPHELATSSYQTDGAREYVGYHHDVAQTKTFFAAVLTLAHAAGGVDAESLERLVEGLVADTFVRPLAAHAEDLAQAGQSFFLGGPTTRPLARFASYKMFEFNRLAHASDVEEYCHTHYFVTRPGDAVVFALADAESARRAREVAPVLAELFDARIVALRSEDLPPVGGASLDVPLPSGATALERHVALLVALEWLCYLWGRVGAPDVDTFHAGYDTERLVAASMRTIRRSEVVGG